MQDVSSGFGDAMPPNKRNIITWSSPMNKDTSCGLFGVAPTTCLDFYMCVTIYNLFCGLPFRWDHPWTRIWWSINTLTWYLLCVEKYLHQYCNTKLKIALSLSLSVLCTANTLLCKRKHPNHSVCGIFLTADNFNPFNSLRPRDAYMRQ